MGALLAVDAAQGCSDGAWFSNYSYPQRFFFNGTWLEYYKANIKGLPHKKTLDKTSGELDEGVQYIERDLPTYICISVVTFLRRSGLNLLIKEFVISGKEKTCES